VNTQEILEKTRQWVESEIAKAKLPYADAFIMTSFNHCICKATGLSPGSDEVERALELLRTTAKAERMGALAVASPIGVIFVIKRALAAQ